MLTITVDTPYWLLDIYFLMIGAGLGLCMQTMLIAVQNTVPAKDMGVATSSATFFRQLGGTLGVAVFLSLLFNSLPDKIQGALQSAAQHPRVPAGRRRGRADPNSPSHATAQGLVAAAQGNTGAASSIGDALNTDSSFLSKLDPIIARPFQVGYVDSTHLVYIIGGIIMALAFVLVLMMKELPLRTMSALDERLEEQRNEDAAALAAEGAFAEVDPEDATSSLSADYEKELEPVATGAHALVGEAGADAGNGAPARLRSPTGIWAAVPPAMGTRPMVGPRPTAPSCSTAK